LSVSVGRTGDGGNAFGKLESFKLAVTDAVTDLSSQAKYMPWVSFSFYNDGPDPIYFSVNEDVADMDTPVYKGEDVSVDMEKRKINKLLFVCDTGKSASIRLYSKA
jgi:hypothetical protein